MLEGVEITCFAASYLVTLALEISRLFLRVRVRLALMIAFAVAGLTAHVLYLVKQAGQTQGGLPLSSWYHWCLIASLVLAAVYVYLAVSRPKTSVGIFMLPLVLALIGLAQLFSSAAPFPRQQAVLTWGMVHGTALLAGTVAALMGLLTGGMYLLQDYRLRRKLPPRQGLTLPSLEWLQRNNERALVWSSALLLAGLAAGAVLNLIRTIVSPNSALSWTDPVVWISAVLFLWLSVVLLFNIIYRPAREGHKVAYLTVASCVLLMLVLGVVLFSPSQHARPGSAGPSPQRPSPRDTAVVGSGQPLVWLKRSGGLSSSSLLAGDGR